MKKKVLLVGPILTQSGYGEHARFVYRSLREYDDEFDIFIQPINWGQTSWIWEDDAERHELDNIIGKTLEYSRQGGQYDISLLVTIPNEWEKYRSAPINIGITAGIETSKVSAAWLLAANRFVDKIIVVSDFSKKIFEETVYTSPPPEKHVLKLETPIHVVNYPVKNYSKVNLGLNLEYDFNFLVVAQWGPRKNLENTVRWFVEEFIDQEVGLVLKVNQKNNSIMDKLQVEATLKGLLGEYPQRKCKVHLLHGFMNNDEIHSLYVHPKIKVLLSLTHGEGYGLPIFEAVYCGMPVVTHDWGGQTDFLYMDTKTKKGKTKKRGMYTKVDYDLLHIQREVVWENVLEAHSQWAYPKQGSVKIKLREAYKNYKFKKSFAKKLQKHVLETFAEQNLYKQMVETITGETVQKISTEELPKVSIITSVYNGDEHIKEFLEDITQQTIFEDKCELVLVNAASPGNEFAVIEEYMEKYPDNIVYKKLDKDPGIYGTWNEGVKLSTGTYLTNANLDDRKAPWSLEKHAKELYLNPEVDLVYADSFITHKPNETFMNNSSEGQRYNFPEFSVDNMKMQNLPHNNPMWRKEMHEKHGLFDDKYRSAGDWEMFLRAASGGSRFKKIHDILGLYYFNPEGISTNPENFEWKRKEEKEVYEKYA